MAIQSSTKLGPYEILSPLGAGGMGEVYVARDTRLERTVAIKVLPESLAADADRLQRFEQEARTLSTVNHPNLLAIFDVGTQGSTHYLVSEFLEGHTLRERMTAGSLSQRKITDYALQLANGLGAAHDKGIVHRDLKPENIFITNDDRVKILDFGLAKQSPFAPSIVAGSATITTPAAATAPGTVMGTVGYMSPEQVRGGVVDHRSDIFSFGAILYEMIAGSRAFKGDSGVETMNAILKEEPPELDPLTVKVSPALNRIVRHCLEKNPANRFQSARDLAFALGALSGTDSTASLPAAKSTMSRWWIAAGIAVIVLAVPPILVFQLRQRSSESAERLEFSIPLQQEAGHLAVSPDGRWLVFVSPDEVSGSNKLIVQRVGSSKTAVLAGTEGATYPFWSPDSAYIGFFADGRLKKIPAAGGATQILSQAFAARGGSWGRRGVIIYAPSVGGPLWSVNADGTNAKVLTDKIYLGGVGEGSHRWPHFLADGDHFIFWAGNFTNAPDDRNSGIYISSLAAKEKKLITFCRSNPAFANGYVFYVGDKQSLRAIPIDNKGNVTGEARIVAEEIGFQPSTYWGAFAVSENGMLIYNPAAGAAQSVLTWFDRSGKESGHAGEPAVIANPSLSPDGSRVSVDITDIKANNVDIWVKDLRHDTQSRFTFNAAEDVSGVWSRDGNSIAYRSNDTRLSVLVKQAQGLGAAKPVLVLDAGNIFNDIVPNSWTPDQKQLLCSIQSADRGSDLALVGLEDGKVTPVLNSSANETNGQISPDGKWLAYASNESGGWEVYVTTFPGISGKWQVSRDGGTEPRWRGDGKEIFYIGPRGTVTAVPVNTDGGFSAGNPVPLFQSHARAQISSTDLFTYDVTRDGQRFLMNRYWKPPQIAPLKIVLNSTAEQVK